MKIKTKRALMLLALLFGIVWNLLCVLDVIPLLYCFISVIIICGYSMALVFLPLLIPLLSKSSEKSGYYPELARREKKCAGMMIALIAVWLVTLIVCIGSLT